VCQEKRDVEVYRQEGAFDAIDKGRRALDVAPALNRGNPGWIRLNWIAWGSSLRRRQRKADQACEMLRPSEPTNWVSIVIMVV
jgi:hypothetical protein